MHRLLRRDGVSLLLRPAVINLLFSCVDHSLVLLQVLRDLELGVALELLNLLLILLEVLKEVVHIFLHLAHLGGTVLHLNFKLNQIYLLVLLLHHHLLLSSIL